MIRQSKGLRAVSTLLLCEDTPGLRERSTRCGADVMMTLPVDPELFIDKVQNLLDAAPRRSYRVILNVIVEGQNKGRSFLCNLENISTTGLLIKTDETLAQGDGLFCSFYLPDGTKVKVRGEIVRAAQDSWSKTGKYGVKFSDMPPDVRAAVDAFIHKELQQHNLGASSGHPAYPPAGI
jgi:Tfp pilus assembly protein PilZ